MSQTTDFEIGTLFALINRPVNVSQFRNVFDWWLGLGLLFLFLEKLCNVNYVWTFLDQVTASIHQEWRRLQRRRHRRVPCPSSPEMSAFSSYSPGSSPPRKEQPLFTLKQVTLICERMLKEREAQITEEYDKVLREKLAGMWVCGHVV